MLHAIGFPDDQMPQLLVHGWWNIGGAKMSKSVGNIVDPFVLADKYGSDALRYYLMSDITTGKDADFSEERVLSAHNDALANSLGNLLEPHPSNGLSAFVTKLPSCKTRLSRKFY